LCTNIHLSCCHRSFIVYRVFCIQCVFTFIDPQYRKLRPLCPLSTPAPLTFRPGPDRHHMGEANTLERLEPVFSLSQTGIGRPRWGLGWGGGGAAPTKVAVPVSLPHPLHVIAPDTTGPVSLTLIVVTMKDFIGIQSVVVCSSSVHRLPLCLLTLSSCIHRPCRPFCLPSVPLMFFVRSYIRRNASCIRFSSMYCPFFVDSSSIRLFVVYS
jgi:hypothetical protein